VAADNSVVLIQLLLPTNIPGTGTPDVTAALRDTRRELADAFDGLTAYLRAPATGWWTAPDGREEQDDVVMVEVVTETFDRAWWRRYATVLAKRFDQEEIHIRMLDIQTLDREGASEPLEIPRSEA
jgi:hypothetical protein